MNRKIVVLAVLATAGTAHAQSSVTLTGGMAIGLKHQEPKVANAAAGAINSVANNDAAANHITWRVIEDLGGGLKASALINVRFDPSDGSIASPTLFAQNTRLGLTGAFGDIGLGRFNGPVDVLRIALDVYTPYGLGPTVYGGPLDSSTRYNGSIVYTTPVFNYLSASFLFVPKANMGSTVNTVEGVVKYVSPTWKFGVGYTQNGGQGIHAATNIKDKDTWMAGVTYDGGRYAAGVTHHRVLSYAAVPQSDRTSFGARVALGAVTWLKAGYEHQKSKGQAAVNGVALGLEYNLSKRTMISLEAGKVSSADPRRDDAGVNYVLGLRHSF